MTETSYFKRIFEQGLFENTYALREQRVPKNKPSAVDNKEHRTTKPVSYVSGDVYDFSSPMETEDVEEVSYSGNGFIKDKEGNTYAVRTQRWTEDAGMYVNCTPCDYVEIFLSDNNSLIFKGEQPFMSYRKDTYGAAFAIEKGNYLEDFCAKWEIAATEETKKNPFFQEMKSKGDVEAVSYDGKKEAEKERKEQRAEAKERAKQEAARKRQEEYANARKPLRQFAGKTFCWGKKTYPGHENLRKDIESLGGFFVKNINKNAGIDYLLVLDGDNDEKKVDKAYNYGIKLLSQDDFEKMYQAAKASQENCKESFKDQQPQSWKKIHSFADIVVGQLLFQAVEDVIVFAKILGVSKEMIHPGNGEPAYIAPGLKVQRIASEYDYDEETHRVWFYPREDKVVGEPFFLEMRSRCEWPGDWKETNWVEPTDWIVDMKRTLGSGIYSHEPSYDVDFVSTSHASVFGESYKPENWEEEFLEKVDKLKDFFAKKNSPMGILGKRGATETTSNTLDTKPEPSELKKEFFGTLEGKNICFTGKIGNFTRKELNDLAIENGAHPMKNVAQGCNFLVMADKDSTSEKANAARRLEKSDHWFRIITPEEFFNLIAKD